MVWKTLSLLALCLAVALPANAQQRRAPETRADIQLSYAPVVQKAAPAVVNVFAQRLVAQRRSNPFADDPFFRRFFGDRGFGVPRERVQQSLGSGVIVSPRGLVVTNNHVIADAQEIKVVLADRSEYDAEILLKDERTDLAVLRIRDADQRFAYLDFANSDDLMIGDLVLAIGNPFGVGQTVTSGIVSALARSQVGVSDFQSFIQTDAAINPGNSGGALVDMQGRLIGINTAIFTRGGGSIGIGFAIPANMVRVVVDSAQGGALGVQRPWLGADLQDVTPDIARSLGLRRALGALVAALHPQGPATRARLRAGDIILRVDQHSTATVSDFNYRFATLRAGSSARLTILRDGRELAVDVAVEFPPDRPPRDTTVLRGRHPLAGATVSNINPAVADEMNLPTSLSGVIVAEVDPRSPAARFGARPGDVLLEINGRRVSGVRELADIIGRRANIWRIAIERDGRVIRADIRG